MTSKENRRSARSKHDSVLEIYDGEGHFIVGIGRLVDFSNVGVCFSSKKVLEKNDALRVRLSLSKEEPIEIAAHVVWVTKKPSTNLYGVEFDSVQKLRT